MQKLRQIIAALGLTQHPEGGWFRETWRAPLTDEGRSAGTAIHLLLEAGETSHWHRMDAGELWLWHAGAPVALSAAAGDRGPTTTMMLGPEILAGQRPQHFVAAGDWRSAHAGSGWALLSCVVVPGFAFSGFTRAPAGWAPGS
ncbi:cupin domain-containing protein [Sphingomonas quercus]|uniref:Cupin domain-containing protein n=1 Tax=Sphingomonas quercus TaxID=2842451 RepID=A0ABS6BFM3_9SPHN|nr:cupin domain-containing protein [Sphingomonas quercus]MBU3077078.1 cupin domain-containing protein [Sphingomonas quercus]